MNCHSTRDPSVSISVSQAIHLGLASDGGLFIPNKLPFFTSHEVESLSELDFPQFAAAVIKPFFAEDAMQDRLDSICATAFNFPLILKREDESTGLLELFHGPTCAFKDFGARFLSLIMDQMPKMGEKKERLVLVATSGDTGSAVASAFSLCTDIPVVILYPKNRISPRQEAQLKCWGKRVKAMAVRGSFDDCQKMVKDAFLLSDWQKRFELISANSINLARLLPQMAYFAYSSLRCLRDLKLSPGFIVPSGNFGNSLGALWAKKMGFPISHVHCAQNANRAVSDFFATGVWSPKNTIVTLANAMDVGNPSNFERMQSLCSNDELVQIASADSVSDNEIKIAIQDAFTNWNEIICPHTATAYSARARFRQGYWIVVSTAHAAKFETIVEPILGLKVPIPASLSRLLYSPMDGFEIDPKLDDVLKYI